VPDREFWVQLAYEEDAEVARAAGWDVVEIAPQAEAEALAEALEWIYAEFVDGCVDQQWPRENDPVVGRAYEALAAYRARHPKGSL
jgi:hypothetical protein